MRVAGVVLAGGRARRFGSDKAAAVFRGRTLLDHAILALRPHCELVLVSGRSHPGHPHPADRPSAGFGPLGGLAGAMQHAHSLGYSHLLSLPCDTPLLPARLLGELRLRSDGAFAEGCPVIGLWPTRLGDALERYLDGGGRRAVAAWADHAGIAPIPESDAIPNINCLADLADLAHRG